MNNGKITVYSYFGEKFGPTQIYKAVSFLSTTLSNWEHALGKKLLIATTEYSSENFQKQFQILQRILEEEKLPFSSGDLGEYIRTGFKNKKSSSDEVEARLRQAQLAFLGNQIKDQNLYDIVEGIKREGKEVSENNLKSVLEYDEIRLREELEKSKDEAEALKKEIQSLKGDLRDTIKDEKAAARATIAISNTTEFWSDRKNQGNSSAFILGISFAICLLLLVTLLGFIHPYTKKSLESVELSGTWADVIFLFEPLSWPLGLTLLSVWVLRLIARQFLTARHATYDASERLAILQTYEAQLGGENTINEKEREIYAIALSRKSQDGLVSDDGLPLEAVLKLINRSN